MAKINKPTRAQRRAATKPVKGFMATGGFPPTLPIVGLKRGEAMSDHRIGDIMARAADAATKVVQADKDERRYHLQQLGRFHRRPDHHTMPTEPLDAGLKRILARGRHG